MSFNAVWKRTLSRGIPSETRNQATSGDAPSVLGANSASQYICFVQFCWQHPYPLLGDKPFGFLFMFITGYGFCLFSLG